MADHTYAYVYNVRRNGSSDNYNVQTQAGTNVTVSEADGVLEDGGGDTFVIGGTTYTYIGNAGGNNFIASFQNGPNTAYRLFTDVQASGTVQSNPAADTTICFMPGTLIRTPDGTVAVETLKIGDAVLTADGQVAPVRWIGRQTVSTLFADPLRVLPIRIRAGALADNVPARDLYVSPDHALLVDGVLVHAGALVNGSSIVRHADVPQTFTYYHVELESHALILAEDVPAETFIDNVDRMAFDNWAEHEDLYGGAAPLVEMTYPRAKAHRQVAQATRDRLAARADALFGTAARAA